MEGGWRRRRPKARQHDKYNAAMENHSAGYRTIEKMVRNLNNNKGIASR
jgi:hypothetical protein